MTTDLATSKGAARHRWPGVLQSLGVDPAYLSGKHGPCPMCSGTDRFRFSDHGGDGKWICNQCGKGDGLDLLQQYHGWSLKEALKAVGEVVGEAAYVAPRKENENKIRRSLNELREEAVPAGDVPEVARYLESRGLVVPPGLWGHRSLQYWENMNCVGRYPAMLGKLILPGGWPIGYHLTWLSQDGTKAPVSSQRKMRKLPKRKDREGYAIRLWPATDTVCIAEGIETAIACWMLWQIPAWSVVNAGEMKKWEPPQGIKQIIVAGDRDDSLTGQEAAYVTGRRLLQAGYDVTVAVPPVPGDWCDYLAQQRKAA